MIGSGIPFVRHLDRVRVPQLVRREPAPHSGLAREPSKLTSGGGRGPSTAAGRAGEDAEERADRQPHAMLGPASDMLSTPIVHADHPSLSALADANQHGPGLRVQIGLGQRKRLADSQARMPQDRDQTASPVRVWVPVPLGASRG